MDNQPALKKPGVLVRPLRESDLVAADHIMRLAFGTYRGLPEPATFMGDSAYVRPRWTADPSAAFCAEQDGQLVGSNFATHWGSVAFFGPLTVHPDLWDQGIGKLLMEPILDLFSSWHTKQMGLYTFADSPKHAGFYQKFGFWPRYLTAVMSKAVYPVAHTGWSRFSTLPTREQAACLSACRAITDSVFTGLDVSIEINAVATQMLGDTVLLWNDKGLTGLAVCHYGPGTEAGSGTCYVKFGAVRPGPAAEQTFKELLKAVEAMATIQGAARLIAGVNTARQAAYRSLIGLGFRTDFQEVAMHRPDEPGYNRPDIFLIDDWR